MNLFSNFVLPAQMTGEFIALLVAFLWGLAAIIWTLAGEKVSAAELNLIKAIIASGLVGITLLLTRTALAPLPGLSLVQLLLSGMVGLGMGDTALFAAFQRIGPTRTSMIKLLSPLLVSLAAFISLHERLTILDFIGTAFTVLGILLVMSERLPHNHVAPARFWQGVSLALFATLAEVVGVVYSRQVLVQTDIDPLWSTLLRLSAAAVFLVFWFLITRQRIGEWLHSAETRRLAKLIGSGVFVGTFVGLWLQQTALKITNAGVAQTLFASSPLFILLIQALMKRQLPSLRALSGVLVAMTGVALIFLGG
jgi:drug/metabolite transporter (DMT)-like permease